MVLKHKTSLIGRTRRRLRVVETLVTLVKKMVLMVNKWKHNKRTIPSSQTMDLKTDGIEIIITTDDIADALI